MVFNFISDHVDDDTHSPPLKDVKV